MQRYILCGESLSSSHVPSLVEGATMAPKHTAVVALQIHSGTRKVCVGSPSLESIETYSVGANLRRRLDFLDSRWFSHNHNNRCSHLMVREERENAVFQIPPHTQHLRHLQQ